MEQFAHKKREFIIFHNLMEDNARVEEEQDYKLTPIASQSLYCDFYRIALGEASYIAKVFPQGRADGYQRERDALMRLDHENIVRPLGNEHALAARLANTLKSQLLVFPEASRGSMFQYLQAYGSLSERTARFYTRQIVAALTHAHSSGILHPNLHTENLLLADNRKVLLCGWSNSLNNQLPSLRQLLFSLGELVLTLTTSRRPFVSKDSKSDPFAKFLTEAHIHKFWEQLEKIMKKMNKQFQFSGEIKELVSSLLLGRVDSFGGIGESRWAQLQVKEEEVLLQLEEQEKKAQQSKESRKAKAQASQKEEKEIIKSNFAMSLNRKPSRSYDIFQEEYDNCEENSSFIQEKGKSDQHCYFTLFDNNPRLVISHLRTRLREAERDMEDLIDPLLLLRDFQVGLQEGALSISLTFGWNFAELQQVTPLCGYTYQVLLKLAKQGETLLGRLESEQLSELNPECVSRMNHWLTDNLS